MLVLRRASLPFGLLVFPSRIFRFKEVCCQQLADFYFLFLLAHLSQRLIGEHIIVYPCSSVRHCRRCRPPFSNVSSETAWPIKAKFYVEPPWEEGMKVYINGPGHMTKMAAMPIYGKNLKKSSSPEPEVL